MRFRLEVQISPAAYRASSPDIDFFIEGPPVCITWKPRDMELFLAIAEGEENFKDDPEFCMMKAAGKLRIFDPFDIAAFDVDNAEAVVRWFAVKAQTQLRRRLPRLIQEFCELAVDHCALALRIENFHMLPRETQHAFRALLLENHLITSFTVESDHRVVAHFRTDCEHSYLFAASPVLRCFVTLLLVGLAAVIPLALVVRSNLTVTLIVLGIEVLAVLMFIACWAPRARALLAFRGLCTLVFATYGIYFFEELARDGDWLKALRGLFAIGWPAFMFALAARVAAKACPICEADANGEMEESSVETAAIHDR
jgi:hypothetical protein